MKIAVLFAVLTPSLAFADLVTKLPEPSILGLIVAGALGFGLSRLLGRNKR